MTGHNSKATVLAVCSSTDHRFSKAASGEIEVVAGYGVRGDAHAGTSVQHLSRVKLDPTQPNLRQVHLIHGELFDELLEHGFDLFPGDLGENITTRGIDLLGLGRDTLLRIGDDVTLSVTGLRNPCHQIDDFALGLLKHVARKQGDQIIRKAGIMTVALHGGIIRPGDPIRIEPPEGPFIPLERV